MKELIISLIEKEINEKELIINKRNEEMAKHRYNLVKMKQENLKVLYGTTIERCEEFIETCEKQIEILRSEINQLRIAKVEVEKRI